MSHLSTGPAPAVRLNRFGYYELASKPEPAELERYYNGKYYQEAARTYQHAYSEAEITYTQYKLQQKLTELERFLAPPAHAPRLLDVGAGEGWALGFFTRAGWACTGLDYSDYGCKQHNADHAERLIVGDIYRNMEALIERDVRYDAVLLDNVLEHVLDPVALLRDARRLLQYNGVLIVEVPNDFSAVQRHLLAGGRIPNPYWVVEPDHISYFNREGLAKVCAEAGFQVRGMLGDFPIDFALFNERTNYVRDPTLGKDVHHARVAIEILMHELGIEQTNALYRALADLGMGRQIIGFFQRDESDHD